MIQRIQLVFLLNLNVNWTKRRLRQLLIIINNIKSKSLYFQLIFKENSQYVWYIFKLWETIKKIRRDNLKLYLTYCNIRF